MGFNLKIHIYTHTYTEFKKVIITKLYVTCPFMCLYLNDLFLQP